MSELSEHVQLTIVADTIGVAHEGFGIGMILSYSPTWVERARVYGSYLDVQADFAIGTPEALAADAYFSQEPHPEQLIIGRGALPPTLQYTIDATTIANTTSYGLNLVQAGATVVNPVAYVSDSTATIQEIHNGLVTALNAVAGKNYTATFAPLAFSTLTFTYDTTNELTSTSHGLSTGDGPIQVANSGGALPTGLTAATNYWVIKIDANTLSLATSLANALAGTAVAITAAGSGTDTIVHQAGTLSPSLPFLVTGNAAGNWFSLELTNIQLMSIAQTHADPGVATDLANIQLQNDTWYGLITLFNSTSYVLAAAAWIEAQSKIYIADVAETGALNTVEGSGSDTLAQLFNHTYNRTAGFYHSSAAAMAAAAWFGRVLPDTPGSETWKFKELAGVTPMQLSATQRSNLRARKANTISTIAGVNVTWEGTVAGGAFGYIDVTRGLDALEDDITTSVFTALINSEKVPYTNEGIAVIRSELKAALKRAVANGTIDDDFVITVPLLSAVSSSDKAIRRLSNVKFSATLQDAIHDVSIDGVVTA